MKYLIYAAFIFSLNAVSFGGNEAYAHSRARTQYANQKSNVIVVMFDGVRWQEFFHGTDPALSGKAAESAFPAFWQTMASQGVVFGDHALKTPFYVSNLSNTSLPGYRSIFTGLYELLCWGNTCGSISHETLQERLVRELKMKKTDVATIASWQRIEEAVEHVKGSTFVNTGLRALVDNEAPDAEIERINKEQAENLPPWPIARLDRYTFAHSMRYLKAHHPRFMFISFNDSDEWGHLNNYTNYIEALHQYDRWLIELKQTLAAMPGYGEKTTLIVLTDHGRGNGPDWVTHNPKLPESKYAWLYGYNPRQTVAKKALNHRPYSHLDVRPTVETIFGLRPQQCLLCGRPIKEIL